MPHALQRHRKESVPIQRISGENAAAGRYGRRHASRGRAPRPHRPGLRARHARVRRREQPVRGRPAPGGRSGGAPGGDGARAVPRRGRRRRPGRHERVGGHAAVWPLARERDAVGVGRRAAGRQRARRGPCGHRGAVVAARGPPSRRPPRRCALRLRRSLALPPHAGDRAAGRDRPSRPAAARRAAAPGGWAGAVVGRRRAFCAARAVAGLGGACACAWWCGWGAVARAAATRAAAGAWAGNVNCGWVGERVRPRGFRLTRRAGAGACERNRPVAWVSSQSRSAPRLLRRNPHAPTSISSHSRGRRRRARRSSPIASTSSHARPARRRLRRTAGSPTLPSSS
jgi:hypothetical protein